MENILVPLASLKLYDQKTLPENGVDEEESAMKFLSENNTPKAVDCIIMHSKSKKYLLVSYDKQGKSWTIPSSTLSMDQNMRSAATTMAWIEAGVKGSVKRHVGIFREKSDLMNVVDHWVYEIEISKALDVYPRKNECERRWFNYREARTLLRSKYLRDALAMSHKEDPIFTRYVHKKLRRMNIQSKTRKSRTSMADNSWPEVVRENIKTTTSTCLLPTQEMSREPEKIATV
ncbi:hypothetical protein BDF14DRAFT_1803392 [Spinellus fusiger]|nr:hypothetical protein BDF14DRAFT_1803392 [Spinellus fusiger]